MFKNCCELVLGRGKEKIVAIDRGRLFVQDTKGLLRKELEACGRLWGVATFDVGGVLEY